MSTEYKIQFNVPKNYNPSNLLRSLPSPIARRAMIEIYNYSIEPDGFYFIDHLVDKKVSSLALGLFIDAAMSVSPSIQIIKLQ